MRVINLKLAEIDVVIINSLLLEAAHKRRETSPDASVQFSTIQSKVVKQLGEQRAKPAIFKTTIYRNSEDRWAICHRTRNYGSTYSFDTWAEAVFFATGTEPYKK